jgi:flagellar basal-body rod modification protein FlgD
MAIPAVNPSDNASAAAALASASASTSSTGMESRFLKLLVTQLSNQDPLNPLDNAQLTSQLAQMSTVSGVEKLNATLKSLVDQSNSGQILQAASLIGRTVLVPGSQLARSGSAPNDFAIETAGFADSVKVTITDAAGRPVRTFDLGSQPAGTHQLSWNGKNDAGVQVADGEYLISISATAAGEKVGANALTYSKVNSVAQGGSGISLDLGTAGNASLGDVRQVL